MSSCHFYTSRRALLVSQQGIITPGTTDAWYPFSKPEYHYAKMLNRSAIRLLRESAGDTLVNGDILAPSQLRQGLAIWDSVLGLPACARRSAGVGNPKSINVINSINDEWSKDTLPALSRVGRISGDDYERPKGAMIVDLIKIPYGWQLLELAHALAHRDNFINNRGGDGHNSLLRWLAYICTCIIFDIPLDISSDGISADIGYLNADINTNCNILNPSMMIPVSSERSPIPDKTATVLQFGVRIEPHPVGFTNQTYKWIEMNRWSCSPTMFVLAGWEGADVITKNPLYSYSRTSDINKCYYGVSVNDLNPASTFIHVINSAKEKGMIPVVDNKRYWNVKDIVNSDVFNNMLMVTPTLPCEDCTKLNLRAEGAPRRPVGDRPKPRKDAEVQAIFEGKLAVSNEEMAWLRWEKDTNIVLDMLEKAITYWEGHKYGHTKIKRLRRMRRVNYNKQRNLLHKIEVLNRKIASVKRNGKLSLVEGLAAKRAEIYAMLHNDIKV